ncbi:hypothetical protein VNI00_008783 [Paramarasmius palmivorus]|uniref:RFX-type winged-helix domain-containing protein n=1 Tax=Paramarasmius palmivorus TaxID=297713 RepID=A0AAW0CVH2_9AGAR
MPTPADSLSPIKSSAHFSDAVVKALMSADDDSFFQAPVPTRAESVETPLMPNVDPSQLALFTEMPWYTRIATQARDRFSMIPNDLHAMASSLLREFQKAYYTNPTYQRIMENRGVLLRNHKSAGPVIPTLFGLRLLDVASMVYSLDTSTQEMCVLGSIRLPSEIPRSAFPKGNTLKGIPSLCAKGGWPQVLTDVHANVTQQSASLTWDSSSEATNEASTSSRQLLVTALRQLETIAAKHKQHALTAKCCFNMDMAAFCINYMMRGHYDLPALSKDLVAELQSAAEKEGVPCEITPILPQITRLRQPLYLALAVSPLILLCDIAPMSNNIARPQMLRAWFHFGTIRPPILRRVEVMLWRQLFAMARGKTTTVHALQQFLEESLPLLPLSLPEADFFNPPTPPIKLEVKADLRDPLLPEVNDSKSTSVGSIQDAVNMDPQTILMELVEQMGTYLQPELDTAGQGTIEQQHRSRLLHEVEVSIPRLTRLQDVLTDTSPELEPDYITIVAPLRDRLQELLRVLDRQIDTANGCYLTFSPPGNKRQQGDLDDDGHLEKRQKLDHCYGDCHFKLMNT